jgi:hypothetical protein
MGVKSYNGDEFETVRSSVPDGFTIELYKRRRFRKSLLVAAVYRPEAGEHALFEVYLGPGKAPDEVIDAFIAEAKVDLQEWRTWWASTYPEFVDDAD